MRSESLAKLVITMLGLSWAATISTPAVGSDATKAGLPVTAMSVPELRQLCRSGWLEEPDAALVDLNQALAHNPHSVHALTNRGLAYFNTGDTSRALADFDAALALSPDDAGIYSFRAAARRKAGDETGAKADEAKMAKLMFGTPQ